MMTWGAGMVIDGGKVLWNSPLTCHQGPCGLCYVLLIALQPTALVSTYYSDFLGDFFPLLGCHWEALDGIASPKIHFYTYLIANVLNTFSETLGIRNHHVDVALIVGSAVIASMPGLGLCVAVFEAVPSLESWIYLVPMWGISTWV